MKNDRQEIFIRWLETYKGLMIRIVRANAKTVQDQDDLFQEILLNFWQSIKKFDYRCSELTWVYRVALNTALVHKRNEKKKKETFNKFKSEAISSFNNLVNEDDDNEQLMDQVYSAIQRLEPDQRSIILMHLDGLSYGEMAEVMGITANNIGVRLTRAKQQLSEMLRGEANGI
jgi:RNA polymerase sigma-70 factor (ECF subfamily)